MKYFIFLFAITISISGFSKKKEPITLKYIKIMDDLIKVKIPSTFTVMADSKVKKLFPKEIRPKLVYSSGTEDILISFDSKSMAMGDSSIVHAAGGISAGVNVLHPKSKRLDDGIRIVKKEKIGFIEYLNKKPEKFYEYIFFIIHKGQVMSCILRHPKKKYKPWKLIAREMMESLVVLK